MSEKNRWESISPGVWIGQPYTQRGNDRWYVIVRHKDFNGGRRRIRPGGPDRTTAREAATHLTRSLGATGTSRIRVGDLLTAYSNDHIRTLGRSTEELYLGHINNHLRPYFGDKVAADLAAIDYFDFGAAMLEPLEGVTRHKRIATVKNCLVLLRAALNWHWKQNKESVRGYSNPADDIPDAIQRVRKRMDIPKKRRKPPYTADDITIILEEARKLGDMLVHDFYVFAAGTGMRLGEIAGIQWENIDWHHRRLTGQMWQIGHRGKPALYKSEREAPIQMDPALIPLLERRRVHRTSDEWVFATDAGTPYLKSNLQKRFTKVRRAAAKRGVSMEKSFHSIRHAFATELLAKGASLPFVSNQLGHNSVALTASVYAHATTDEVDMAWADFGEGEAVQ